MVKIVYVILGILEIEIYVLLAINLVVNALVLKLTNVQHVQIFRWYLKMDFVLRIHHVALASSLITVNAQNV